VDDLDKTLQLANELVATKQSDIRQIELGFQLSSLTDASWRTADRTGALAYMDYADVKDYAELYGLQDLYTVAAAEGHGPHGLCHWADIGGSTQGVARRSRSFPDWI